MPPVLKNALPSNPAEWLRLLATSVSVLVTGGLLIWRASALHSEAMSKIDRNSQGIAALNNKMDDLVTREELDREFTHHAAFHTVSTQSISGLRDDIKELKEELRRRMP